MLLLSAVLFLIDVAWADEPDLAQLEALVELSYGNWNAGKPQEALKNISDATGIARSLDDPLGLAEVMQQQAFFTFQLGDTRTAVGLMEEVLTLQESALDSNDPTLAITRANLGRVVESLGQLDRAEALYQAALDQALRIDPRGADVPRLQGLLAETARKKGDPARAAALQKDTLARLTQLLGPTDVDVIWAWSYLADAQQSAGDLEAALESFRTALDLARDANLDVGAVSAFTSGLASTLTDLGDLIQARRVVEDAYREAAPLRGNQDADVVSLRAVLANIAMQQGDNAGAEAILREALEHANPDDDVTNGLRSLLAVSLLYQNKYEEAATSLTDDLELALERLGPDHPSVANIRNSLAGALAKRGDLAGAEAGYAQAAQIAEAALGPNHPTVAQYRMNRGVMLYKVGETDAARVEIEQAISIYEDQLGATHPSVANALVHLFALESATGSQQRARMAARRALDTFELWGVELLRSLSERERIALIRDFGQAVDALVIALDEPSDAEESWDAVLAWKGRAGRSLSNRSIQHSKIGEVRRALARAVLAGRMDRAADLREQKESLEREQSGAAVQPTVTRDALCAALAPDEALVDMWRVQQNADRYVAWVLRGETCELVRVDLGDGPTIDAAVTSWRKAITDPSAAASRIDRRGAVLREQIFDPVVASLEGIDRLWIAPDAALTAVPLAALPSGDGYLLETWTIGYLESAAELVRAPTESGDAALLIGGVAYGADSAPGLSSGAVAPCLDQTFADLPETAEEVREISGLFRRKTPVTLLEGADATREDFLARLPGSRFVHVATHGFFATGECRSAMDAGTTVTGFNPMLLSGLVFAGANDPAPDRRGILTAEELAGVDLTGVELVVLSACETGLGEVASGEGVLGLRRAVIGAGARSLVMSLWAVPDSATRTLMTTFYPQVLRRRRAPVDALRAAQLEVLRRAREEMGNGRPQDWGAFIVSGG